MDFIKLIKTILGVSLIISSGAISLLVLKQEAKENSFGTVGSNNSIGSGTYWNKNKLNSLEGKQILATRILIIAFIAEIVALNIIG